MEEYIWSFIKPAENRNNPPESDGYNKSELYIALRKMFIDQQRNSILFCIEMMETIYPYEQEIIAELEQKLYRLQDENK